MHSLYCSIGRDEGISWAYRGKAKVYDILQGKVLKEKFLSGRNESLWLAKSVVWGWYCISAASLPETVWEKLTRVRLVRILICGEWIGDKYMKVKLTDIIDAIEMIDQYTEYFLYKETGEVEWAVIWQ